MTRKEAIDKVYGMSGTKEQHEALDFLVPEIRELREFYDRQQEDERIRKELKEAFEAYDIESTWNGIPIRSIFAWLEKQKEQNLIMANSPQLKEQKKEKFPPYVTGFKGDPDPAGTSDLEEAAKEYASKTLCDPDDGPSTGLAKESFIAGAEWQKEQKPADEQFPPLGGLDAIKAKYYDDGFKNGFDEGVESVKPAEWSEEGKRKLNRIYEIIGQAAEEKPFGSSKRIIGDKEAIELQDFLQSLRPSWKPSEEQMKALLNAEGLLRKYRHIAIASKLAELYEQLKKL